MAAQDRTTNQTEINTLIADNVIGDISASDVRTVVTNQNDSNFNLASNTLTDVAQPTGSKTTPIDADSVLVVDSADSNTIKRTTWANIKTTLNSYLSTLYQAILAEGAFVDGDKTKLDGIETGADVTDSTNVDAAGATMNTDTDLSSNSYFLDEDDLSSNDATKVASQQSIKAYVDNNTIGAVSQDTTPSLGGNLDLGEGNGITITSTSGAVIAQYDVVQLQSDGKFDPASAAAQGSTSGLLGIALNSTAGADQAVTVLLFGLLGGQTGLTAGSTYYLSTSGGAITATQPATSGNQVRVIGVATSTTTLFVNISRDYFEIA